MFRLIAAAVMAMLVTSHGMAAEIVIPLPEATSVETNEFRYDCGDRTLAVTYINAGPVSLAVTQIDDQMLVASNVISGSGARYAGSHYIWWSKGDTADLYDLMQGEDEPVATCRQSP